MHGCQPTSTSAVLDENGLLLSDLDAVTARWCRHFTKVLHVVSVFSPVGIDRMPTLETRRDLDDPPTSDEFQRALSKLQPRKAGGDSGVIPEMLVFGGPVLHTILLDLFQRVWKEDQVFTAWRDTLVVPVPKKGDLTMCDNWRDISLLDVAGKLLGQIVQEQLQCIAESVLLDSQCGFRRGQGCSDMIFVARQLVEKAREHNSLLFVLFVDLKKAFDSVPYDALWQVLERFGIPPVLLAMIRSFHVDMRAAVLVKGRYSDSFVVRNGVRQGCTIAPVLFNLYFCAMVDDWRKQCPQAGVTFCYRHGCKLIGDRTPKSQLLRSCVTASKFADDDALYAASCEGFVTVVPLFVAVAGLWGLTVNLVNSKGMVMALELTLVCCFLFQLEIDSLMWWRTFNTWEAVSAVNQ